MPRKYTKWKIVVGVVLLILSPKHFLVDPRTPGGFGYDFGGIAWWVFIVWLLWSGFGYRFFKKPDKV